MDLIVTGDGSHTLFVPGLNEQYHSVNGAITESEYVYIERGYRYCNTGSPAVFEVGFGTGLNCMLTLLEANRTQRHTSYISIEKFPLDPEITGKLNYGRLVQEGEKWFGKIHDAPWNQQTAISEYFTLLKVNDDLAAFLVHSNAKWDVVYFDAFGPDKQPEMWTQPIFAAISSLTSAGGILVTYSAKGEVRRTLAACGFVMERLPGPPGKNQMLRGIKPLSNV